MNKIKTWWKKTGITNILTFLIGIALIWLVPGDFVNLIGVAAVFFAIGINWQALKDLTDLDEKFDKKWDAIREEIKEILGEHKKLSVQAVGGENPPKDDEEGGTM